MTVNVRALAANYAPRHRCQLRRLRDYFPTPYSSHKCELERNLIIRTTVCPYTTHRRPPRTMQAKRLRHLSRNRYQGGRFVLGHLLFAGFYPDLLFMSGRRRTSPLAPEDHGPFSGWLRLVPKASHTLSRDPNLP